MTNADKCMLILPLRGDLQKYLERHNLVRKFAKQKRLLEENIFHPGLNKD